MKVAAWLLLLLASNAKVVVVSEPHHKGLLRKAREHHQHQQRSIADNQSELGQQEYDEAMNDFDATALVPLGTNCTGLIGIGIDPDDPNGQNATFLSCMTPAGLIHVVRGVCKIWIEDQVTKDILKSSLTEMDVPDARFAADTDEVVLNQFPPLFFKNPPLPNHKHRSTGERTVLAVRIGIQPTITEGVLVAGQILEPTVTENQLRDSIFGNLHHQMQECSQHKLDLQMAADRFSLLGSGMAQGGGRTLTTNSLENKAEPIKATFDKEEKVNNKVNKVSKDPNPNLNKVNKVNEMVPRPAPKGRQAQGVTPQPTFCTEDPVFTGGLDVVFVMDQSGSMGNEIVALQAEIPHIFQALQAASDQGSFRASIVGYGQWDTLATRTWGRPEIIQTFTNNQTIFEAGADLLIAYGAREPGFQTITEISANNIEGLPLGSNFPSSDGYCVLIFTDEDSDIHYQDYVTQQDAITALQNTNGVLFEIGLHENGTKADQYSYYPVVEATGGEGFKLTDFVSDRYGVIDSVLNGCFRTIKPDPCPSNQPSMTPSLQPTAAPIPPTTSPTLAPTDAPTLSPSFSPSGMPTISMVPSASPSSTPTTTIGDISGGVATVYVNTSSSVPGHIVNSALELLLLQFDATRVEDLADFIFFCLPANVMDLTAYSYVNSYLSVYNDTACLEMPIQMRELGHNLGLGPSRSWGQLYGDRIGAMGDNSFTHEAKCFNPAKLYQLGWYDPEVHTYRDDSPEETFTLHGFIKAPEVYGRIKIVSIARTNDFSLYLMFNWVYGSNSDSDHGRNKVTLVEQSKRGVEFADSMSKAFIGEGESYFEEGYFDGKCDLTINVTSIDVQAGTCVITITGCPEFIPTATPSVAPTGPTRKPTLRPSVAPTSACVPVDDICATEADCCDNGEGFCTKEVQNDGFNNKILCKSEASFYEPPPEYAGTCNDNGKCEANENCFNCPHDCNALLSGPRANRYCCDGWVTQVINGTTVTQNVGFYSVRITDPRCEC